MEGSRVSSLGLVDTTLRDGEQTAGIAFSVKEKIEIARMLDQMGIQVIEAGTPIMGVLEQKAICGILESGLSCQVVTWNRILEKDVAASIQCGATFVHLSAPVSDLMIFYKLGKDRKWIIEQLRRTIYYAASRGCVVSVGAEDASRADEGFMLEFARVAKQEGAIRLRYADTVGILDPFAVYDRLSRLVPLTGIPIDFHAHNDFGLATANVLAAVRAGVGFVSTTVNGIGERAGNAALEQVLNVLNLWYNIDTGVGNSNLVEVCRLVAKATTDN